MIKNSIKILLLCTLMSGCSTLKPQPVRIDASSHASADASYQKMMKTIPERDRIMLAMAVLALNMEGVKNANDPDATDRLNSPSAGHIRHKIAGMTAADIIALVARTPGIRLEIQSR